MKKHNRPSTRIAYALLLLSSSFITSCALDDVSLPTFADDTDLKDGITFEEDGTALAGRESGGGWLDIECESGEVVVRVVNSYAWKIVDEGNFNSDACDDNRLEPGELAINDIPEDLRG